MKNKRPPYLARKILQLFLPSLDRDCLMGDYEYFFQNELEKKGYKSAWLWYWLQVMKTVPEFIIISLNWSISMIINYLKVAIRNLWKFKFYTALNILGLTIGLTAVILITVFIKQEFSYDEFHSKSDRIYRAGFYNLSSAGELYSASSPAIVADYLISDYPGIENVTRLFINTNELVQYKEKKFLEQKFAYADSSFFDIFSFEVLSGNPEKILKRPDCVVLSKSAVQKYFGNENPLGKILRLQNKYDLIVTGVINDIPHNSSFHFDFLANFELLKKSDDPNAISYSDIIDSWSATFGSQTFILLEKNASISDVENVTKNIFYKNTKIPEGEIWKLIYQNLNDIYLYPGKFESNSPLTKVISISVVAFLILILGCINFINLTTARSTNRVKEIGVRKVLGAKKPQLIKQFLSETFVIVLFSLFFSFFVFEFFKSTLSELLSTKIISESLYDFYLLGGLFVGTIVISVIAGLYPSLLLSSYQPAQVIRGGKLNTSGDSSAKTMRKALVIAQFAISVVFVTGTILINMQINFMNNYNYGIDNEYVLNVISQEYLGGKTNALKNEINTLSGVTKVSSSLDIPFGEGGFDTQIIDKRAEDKKEYNININVVDEDYFDMFGVNISAGRNFSSNFYTTGSYMIINEKLAKNLGYENPNDIIGQKFKIKINSFEPEIIGVIEDCNFRSLHNHIQNQVYLYSTGWATYISAKVSSENLKETVSEIGNIWTNQYAAYPFDYVFTDDSINSMYEADRKNSDIMMFFSVLAIIIACLGLLGLTSYSTVQRKKEIGIRKTMGASISTIIKLISSEFIVLVLIANLIAIPVSYFLFAEWIAGFAYKISFPWWIVGTTIGITILITIITVFWQCLKAARQNPIEALNYE